MHDRIDYLEGQVKRLGQENDRLKRLLSQHGIDHESNTAEPDDKVVTKTKQNQKSDKLSPQEKIDLYRSYFRGREDVYALRWENAKTGRKGYSPACENEWRPGVCGKPKIKCSVCPNQQWKSLNDQALYAHLTGKNFIGVYPLLQNEHCYFLAIDFDKEHWQKDVTAFVKVCDEYQVPRLVERSQSGNGAHVWICFGEPISASMARNLGTALLTLTMQLHSHLSMDSYDRLFPNQDTLPKGGFGNLIALPLQGKRRAEGHCTFIDVERNFSPFADPWQVLAETNQLSLVEVQSLLTKIQSEAGILDVTSIVSDEEEALLPWERQVAANRDCPIISEILPKQLEIVKANLLYVPMAKLPAKLINQVRKLAAFQNPEFYRAQAMRLSTFGKPRVIHCAEVLSDYIGLPRGCETELFKLLSHYKIQTDWVDKCEVGNEIQVSFLGELSSDQQDSVNTLLKYDIGVLSARTGFGKTVVAAKMIAERKTNTLILVHRQQLLEQWQERLMSFLGLDKKQIGVVKSGKFKLTKHIDIAMLQSLAKQGEVVTEVSHYGHVVVDECHHLSAFSFEQVLRQVKAKYVLGLTATPYRKDGHHPIIFMQCGPIRFQTSKKVQLEQNLTVYSKQVMLQRNQDADGITALYQSLMEDEVRNQFIFEELIKAYWLGRYPLLLTSRKKQLDWFEGKLSEAKICEVYVLKGGMCKKSKETIMRAIEKNTSNRILLATGSYIGEGFDDPKLDTLFLALPISWHGTLQQYLGRLHRAHRDKQDIQVYDYVDVYSPICMRMYQKRVKKYKALGYQIE